MKEMGFLDKFLGKGEDEEELGEILEEALKQEDAVTPKAKMYVKKIELRNEGDVQKIIEELDEGNIILIDITPIKAQHRRLSMFLGKVKTFAHKNNGDIAMVTMDIVIATPKDVKIAKKPRI